MSYQGGTHIYTIFIYFFNAFYFKIRVILRGGLRGEHSAQLVCHGLALFLIHFISKFMSYQGGTHIYTSFKYFFNAFYFKIQVILKGELRGEHSAQLVCHGLALFLIHFISKFMSYQGGTHIYTSFKYFFNAFHFKIQVILKGELRGEHSAQLVCRILKVPPCPASMS